MKRELEQITKILLIEDVAQEMCENYCKYPAQYRPDEHGGVELAESEICQNCPITKLL